jgi:hypothetical protein
MGSWWRPHGAAAQGTEGRPTAQEGAASQGARDGGGILCYGAAAMALQFGGKKRLGGLLKNDIEEGVVGGFIHKKVGYHRIVDEGLGL